MYNFATLDPRIIPAAVKANDEVFASPVYGIEVTVPALAKRCAFNLDPQHSGEYADRAAIEIALIQAERRCCAAGSDCLLCQLTECPADAHRLPREWETLATIRPDLDSVGSMAIFNLRARDVSLEPAKERIAMVAVADKFARGGYTAKLLPTRENPWPEEATSAESSRPLAAISAAVMDFKVLLTDRVSTMERWLLTGEEPEQYRTQVEKERLDMITALETGQIKYAVVDGYCSVCGNFENMQSPYCGKCGAYLSPAKPIAVVESTHRAATMVGYSLAPVVVAFNPSFKQGPGEPYKKFTICQFTAEYVDLRACLAELNELEAGWGGSPTIGGSPQGISSTLTIDKVVEVVERYLK